MRLLATVLLLTACQPDVGASSPVVDGSCTSNSQCQNQCVTGEHYSAGNLCSRPCTTDSDCPEAAACVANQGGGICAPTCKATSDCTSYSRGWICNHDDHFGSMGEVNVCRDP